MGSELVAIGFCLCIIGLAMEVFLNFEVKKLTQYFVNHSTGYEICAILFFAMLPFGLTIDALQKWSLAIPDLIRSSIILLVIVWPFFMYGMHKNFKEHAITLGITSNEGM